MGHFPYWIAGWIFLVGLYGAVSSRNLIHLCICLGVIQSSTYVFLLTIGYRKGGHAPILTLGHEHGVVVDPVVQAMMLTDIVVEATVIALLLALAIQIHKRTGTLDPNRNTPLKG